MVFGSEFNQIDLLNKFIQRINIMAMLAAQHQTFATLLQPTQDTIQGGNQYTRTGLAVARFHHVANVVKIVDNDEVMRFEGFVQGCSNAFFDGQGVKGLDFVKKISQAQKLSTRLKGQALEHEAAAVAIIYTKSA